MCLHTLMKLSIFSSVVQPTIKTIGEMGQVCLPWLLNGVMEYCGEVWGPSLLRLAKGLDHLWDNPLQKVQNMFLRELGHVRKTVHTTIRSGDV
jgi:hypothetical protein